MAQVYNLRNRVVPQTNRGKLDEYLDDKVHCTEIERNKIFRIVNRIVEEEQNPNDQTVVPLRAPIEQSTVPLRHKHWLLWWWNVITIGLTILLIIGICFNLSRLPTVNLRFSPYFPYFSIQAYWHD